MNRTQGNDLGYGNNVRCGQSAEQNLKISMEINPWFAFRD